MWTLQYIPIVVIIVLGAYYYLKDRQTFKNGWLRLETVILLGKFIIPEELKHIDTGSKLTWFISSNPYLFLQDEKIELLTHLNKVEKLLRRKDYVL